MNLEQLKECISEAGVVGAGGAGFPAHIKLSADADVIIINAVECEPLIKADYYIIKNYIDRVIKGAKLIRDAIGGKELRIFAAMKEGNAKSAGFTDGQDLAEGVTIKTVDNFYPAGDEVVLIYEITGRVVMPGSIPITSGVVVFNAETVYNIANAAEGIPVTEKFLTVAGEGVGNITMKVPTGTSVGAVLKRCGAAIADRMEIIDGGPMMGKIIDPYKHTVTKTTKAFLVLPEDHKVIQMKKADSDRVIKRASSGCCGCRMCSDMCPRALLGYELEPHRMVTAAGYYDVSDPKVYLNAGLCSGCGVCEAFACCQNISARAVYGEIKMKLRQNNLAYKHDGGIPDPHIYREYRKVSSERLMQRLGLWKYGRCKPEYIEFGEVK